MVSKKENPDYRRRVDNFNNVAPNYDSFFNCIIRSMVIKGVNWMNPHRAPAMRPPVWLLTLVLFATAGGLAACSEAGTVARSDPSPPVSTPSPPVAPPRQDEPPRQSLISRVDFGNFTYPRLPTLKCSMAQVRLVNGTYEAPGLREKRSEEDCWSVDAQNVVYGDVNGDGVEEAIVVLYAEAGGNESREDVFVYTSQGERPKLLWKFATGDGAHGGLRRVYAGGGKLVVELYGLGAKLGEEVYGHNPPEVGTCCPKHFTRTTYRWSAGRFQQDGESVVFPNQSGSSETEMPLYQPRKEN